MVAAHTCEVIVWREYAGVRECVMVVGGAALRCPPRVPSLWRCVVGSGARRTMGAAGAHPLPRRHATLTLHSVRCERRRVWCCARSAHPSKRLAEPANLGRRVEAVDATYAERWPRTHSPPCGVCGANFLRPSLECGAPGRVPRAWDKGGCDAVGLRAGVTSSQVSHERTSPAVRHHSPRGPGLPCPRSAGCVDGPSNCHCMGAVRAADFTPRTTPWESPTPSAVFKWPPPHLRAPPAGPLPPRRAAPRCRSAAAASAAACASCSSYSCCSSGHTAS